MVTIKRHALINFHRDSHTQVLLKKCHHQVSVAFEAWKILKKPWHLLVLVLSHDPFWFHSWFGGKAAQVFILQINPKCMLITHDTQVKTALYFSFVLVIGTQGEPSNHLFTESWVCFSSLLANWNSLWIQVLKFCTLYSLLYTLCFTFFVIYSMKAYRCVFASYFPQAQTTVRLALVVWTVMMKS